MAEEEKKTPGADAPAEGSEGEPGGQAGLVNKILGLFKKNKKIALISIGAVLLIVAGLATYFLLKPEDPAEVAAQKQAAEENAAESEDVDTEDEQDDVADEPVVYKLSPFFLPLMRGNRETGQFVHLSLSFILSSQRLERDIEKNHAQIRAGIYTILKRKKVNDYLHGQKKLEGRLKQEIIVLANGLLERGTGTIDGILFSQFLVK